jgi:hypothetical protein
VTVTVLFLVRKSHVENRVMHDCIKSERGSLWFVKSSLSIFSGDSSSLLLSVKSELQTFYVSLTDEHECPESGLKAQEYIKRNSMNCHSKRQSRQSSFWVKVLFWSRHLESESLLYSHSSSVSTELCLSSEIHYILNISEKDSISIRLPAVRMICTDTVDKGKTQISNT